MFGFSSFLHDLTDLGVQGLSAFGSISVNPFLACVQNSDGGHYRIH